MPIGAPPPPPTPRTLVCGCAIAYALKNIPNPDDRIEYLKGLDRPEKRIDNCLHEYGHPLNAYRMHTKNAAYLMVVTPFFHRMQDLHEVNFDPRLIWFTLEQWIPVRASNAYHGTLLQVETDFRKAIGSRFGMPRECLDVYETEVGRIIPWYPNSPPHRTHRMVVGVPPNLQADVKHFINAGDFERVALVQDSPAIVEWSQALEVRERPPVFFSKYTTLTSESQAKRIAVADAARRRAKRAV